jgi:hypothetical protein
LPSGPGTSFTSTPACTSCQSWSARCCSNRRSIALGVPTMYPPPRPRRYARFPSLTIPRSRTHTRSARPYFASIASTIASTVVESFVLPSKTS